MLEKPMGPHAGELAHTELPASHLSVRERLSKWLSFSALMAFFIVTIALWGYAAWWAVAKLVGLFV
jgi:hypothetical protein